MTQVSFYPVFFSRTNLKLHNNSVIPKIVIKDLKTLGSSKASCSDCIPVVPVVVLKNCEPEFSYMLIELFSMCLKKPCFRDCWKVSFVVPVCKNVGESSATKNHCPVSLVSMVSQVL